MSGGLKMEALKIQVVFLKAGHEMTEFFNPKFLNSRDIIYD